MVWNLGRGRLARSRRRGPLALLAMAAVAVSIPTAAADDTGAHSAERGVAYLLDNQGADGGFGEGAITPDAVSAIAQQAQSSDLWSAKEAIDAIAAAESAEGRTPLDALDALAEADPPPDLAAQLVSRAVVPLGLDPENFDAGRDGTPVDLVGRVAAGRSPDGSFGSLAATAEAVLAFALVDHRVPEATVGFLRAAQQENGGWNAGGDPDGTVVDPVTTGLVVEALVAAGGVTAGDASVTPALAMLARNQGDSGGWPAARNGEDDPSATAWAMGAIRSGGFDPDQRCWRDTVDPARATEAYASPSEALVATQDDDGSFTGPVGSIEATALAVQGTLGRWLPTERASETACGPGGGGGINPSLVFLAVFALVIIGGAAIILRRGNR